MSDCGGPRASDADGSAAETGLLPVLEVDHAVAGPEPSVGGYVLELLDDAGAVLRSVSFAAQTVVAGVSETGESVPALELPPRPRSMAGHNPSRSKRPPVTARSAHWTARPCRGQAASTVRWAPARAS